MSDLTIIEKRTLERFLDMGGGYVLDFSNRTFQDFILDSLHVDIYEDKYDYGSGSKANLMRGLWRNESNYVVGKLLADLIEYWRSHKLTSMSEITGPEQALFDECKRIADRLKQDSPVENIEVIQADTDDRSFSLLAKSIRESIQKNEPEAALDRLHTYVVRYTRQLCEKHGISCDINTPLHSLFGGYIKHLKNNGLIASVMTERILKSSISILEAFNDVRNNQSFAHDNPVLNYNESILIFNNVSSAIKFINSIEQPTKKEEKDLLENDWNDDIPF